MKKIHNENSRSEYFTFTPLSDGDRREKLLWVQTHAYKRVNKFIIKIDFYKG